MATAEHAKLKAHIDRLDVLRAVSFLAVFAFHFSARFHRTSVPFVGNFPDYRLWPRDALMLLPAGFGWIGVAYFYVLSGFCIHYATLHRREPFTVRDFYWRRFLRIYPAYIVAVLVCTSLAHWLPYKYFGSWQVITHVFMFHNLLKLTMFGLDGVLWSLGVEMQFYLLYPLLLRLARIWGGLDRCLAFALALNVVGQLYIGYIKKGGWSAVSVTWGYPLMTWCDWILGACVAAAYIRGERLFRAQAVWLFFSAGMLAAALNFRTLSAEAFLFGAVFFAVVMQIYLAVRSPLRWIERALIPVGVISYSLYLWHEPVMILVDRAGFHLGMTRTSLTHVLWDAGLTVTCVTLVAATSYYFLEVGAPRVIRRFLVRRHLAEPPLPGPADESPLVS